jgi:hypothetical protein
MNSHPPVARRYLDHAIAPGTPAATAVHLAMSGAIRVGGWHPFTAEEVIEWPSAMTWSARVRMLGLPVRGHDRLVDGRGEMRWRLLGLIPLVTAAGPDIDRSTAGRLAAELVWLPSVLASPAVHWEDHGADRTQATFAVQGHAMALELAIEPSGRLISIALERWGSPDRGPFRTLPFGGIVEAEGVFGGYTIPTRLRIGWHPGTPRFEAEGEFFRATVDAATFR